MTVREDINAKLATLQRHASSTYEQGRTPRDVPLSLQFGLDIMALMARLADTVTDAHAEHFHEVEINKQKRATGVAQ